MSAGNLGGGGGGGGKSFFFRAEMPTKSHCQQICPEIAREHGCEERLR